MNMNIDREVENKPQTYVALGEHSGSILAHINLEVISWCFILPIAVMLSIAHSRYTVPVQLVFLIINAIALLFGIIYNTSTPDLYENNAHHKVGWIATWVIPDYARVDFSTRNMTDHQRLYSPLNEYRWSGDSGQGTVRPTTPEEEHFPKPDGEEGEEDIAMSTPLVRGLLRNRALDKFFILHQSNSQSGVKPSSSATGIVTYSGIFRGFEIFSGLAHFIKDGIFFWYGLVILGRYMGCWAYFRWSWNLKPASSRAVTGELVESALIFTYGSTNVFLEHLAGWGKAWTAQDLEHVSISVVFFGAGLSIMGKTAATTQQEEEQETSGVSFNPMPLLTIFLLGIMMGGHKQEQMVSIMVYKQWGNLLSGAAMARAMTYITMYIKPLMPHLPARPPSELVGAFCLMSGGLIFMSSAKNIMDVMDRYDLDAMFTFNVALGLSCFIMAYEIIVLVIKAWAVKESLQYHAHSRSSV
ncbi:hypothetical protein TCE0_044r16897 [Talaromyces pinophilus]|uniref:Integral membrane protein n=1 Tax=Talaromyces pinophilus TaxID=128442 RepID=A0A478EDH0_TALPI|nr:hypothetical protein TCE0_044r16897 [Talaromyces pinophilus]